MEYCARTFLERRRSRTRGNSLVIFPFTFIYSDSDSDFDEDGYLIPDKKNKLRDGDYIYTEELQGVYWKKGVILDLNEEEDNLYDEWKNKITRNSFAKSSLIKVRHVSSGSFFTRGKLNDIGRFVKNQNVSVVYINTMLSAIQQKKLQK